MAGTMVSGTCTSRETKEEKVGMYPPEWWWAERQVSEVLAENPGELKSIKIGWNAWTDINFYKWCFWFWFNSLVPGRSEYNHESCRQLSSFR